LRWPNSSGRSEFLCRLFRRFPPSHGRRQCCRNAVHRASLGDLMQFLPNHSVRERHAGVLRYRVILGSVRSAIGLSPVDKLLRFGSCGAFLTSSDAWIAHGSGDEQLSFDEMWPWWFSTAKHRLLMMFLGSSCLSRALILDNLAFLEPGIARSHSFPPFTFTCHCPNRNFDSALVLTLEPLAAIPATWLVFRSSL